MRGNRFCGEASGRRLGIEVRAAVFQVEGVEVGSIGSPGGLKVFVVAKKTGMLVADAPKREVLVQWMWSVDLAGTTRLGALQGQGPRLACFYPASPGKRCSANT